MGGRDRAAHSERSKSPHDCRVGARRKAETNQNAYSGQNPPSARCHSACCNRRGRTPPAGGGSRSAIMAVRWLASHGVLAACDKSTKMARGTKSPPKEGREKIRILISSSLAVGALRTYNQSANSITANSMSKPYCRSDNGAGRLTTSVPLFLPIDPDPGFQTSPLKEGREKIRFLISSGLAVGALRTHDTLFHRGAGTRHPGGIRCGTCRPGTPTANSTTAN